MSEAVILLKEILEELDANVATNERIADSDGMKAAVSSARTKLEIWKRRESALSAQGEGTHKWEPDFSEGECVDCLTCGICGTTHNTPVEDAELIEKQRLRICVLLADLDIARRELSHAPEGETPFCRVCGEAIRGENAEEDSRNDLSKYYFKTPDAEEGDF